MSGFADQLGKADRDEVSAALQARQKAVLNEHVQPAPHQRRLFPIEGGANAPHQGTGKE
jgi:hypothetical protein